MSLDPGPNGALSGVNRPDVGEYHPGVPLEIARVADPWSDATADNFGEPMGPETHQLPAARAGMTDQAMVKPTASMTPATARRAPLTSYCP
ncbi:MAG TPA: hypothetical protein VNF24_01545 [Candidatus Acidoferrales bacterium]|nr:hypothetical protein [Candidatus Acidoferrales bacterium]